jgi:NAD(P)-dependent dehydrogenase (short-subunit alcohol dehydrogenase family)
MGILDNKVVVVTGGTSGIGARSVELFVEEGANVVFAGRRKEEGELLAQRIGPAASFLRTNVAEEAEIKGLVEYTLAKFGRLDCIFNNAGIPGRVTSIAEVDVEHLDEMFRVHVRGVLLGMKHAAPVMIRQGSGSIINTGSIAGSRTGFSAHPYSAAKAAIIHLTRCVALELGEKNVRVNSISPGSIVTGIFAKGAGVPSDVADRTATRLMESFAKFQSIPRPGSPDDVARAALYLASDASSFVNGQDLVVDGGSVGGQPWSEVIAWRRELADQFTRRTG